MVQLGPEARGVPDTKIYAPGGWPDSCTAPPMKDTPALMHMGLPWPCVKGNRTGHVDHLGDTRRGRGRY